MMQRDHHLPACSAPTEEHGVSLEQYGAYMADHRLQAAESCIHWLDVGSVLTCFSNNKHHTEAQPAATHFAHHCICVDQAKSIVHGDVKPANFMLKQRFREPLRALERGAPQGSWLKAVDFGCSQSYRNKASLSRRTGTPVYMAPEVFKRDYLQASDMWSLGMMMYQLLTGRFPFW